MIHQLTKTIAVVVSSTILATLATNAMDMRAYLSSSMLGSLFFAVESGQQSLCPEHMTLVDTALEPFCVDMYEASTGDRCVYADPLSAQETLYNVANSECAATSRPQAMPWRYVSVADAQQLCSRAGKRLPTAAEWYKAALGTPDVSGEYTDDGCNVARNRADGTAPSGGGMRCVSNVGAYDMVGNVWEWVEEEVVEGVWRERQLPSTGYVAGVDMQGVAFTTSPHPTEPFSLDRFWTDPHILAGMMRGGYYEGKGYAGVFATYAASPPTFTGDAVGFRCVTNTRAH